MATRADFYVMLSDKSLEFIGSTSNSYYGDFEKATSLKDYLKSVKELLAENGSIPGKWYWPWKHSKISDEVFIFKLTPTWLFKNKGVLMTKVHVHDDGGCDNPILNIVKYADRYDERYYDTDGYYQRDRTELVNLPIFERA